MRTPLSLAGKILNQVRVFTPERVINQVSFSFNTKRTRGQILCSIIVSTFIIMTFVDTMTPKRGKYSYDVMQCFKIILVKETKAQRPSRAGGCGVILALFKDGCPLTEVGWWFITMSIAAKTAMLYIQCVHSALAQISCTLPVTTHWSNHRPYIHKHS